MKTLAAALMVLCCACLTTRSMAAEALSCPEDAVEKDALSAEAAGLILLSQVFATSRPRLARGPGASIWRGCGSAVACTGDGCTELESSKAAHLVAVVPQLMEQSRDTLARGAAVTRTGTFSWELAADRPLFACRLVAGGSYHCDEAAAAATPP